MNLPIAFEEEMKALLGPEEYEEYLKCFDEPRHYGLRVNTAKISVEDFLKIAPWPLERVPWIQNGFYYDGESVQPAKHPYYFAGLYYLQEPSAMTPADRLPVEPGDRVLDVCAAPGGKATELGAKLNGTGVLAANDLSSSRAKGLLKNLELFGIGNALVLSEEPGKLVPYFREYFDKILIDAPCSGEGMFRKDRKMVRRLGGARSGVFLEDTAEHRHSGRGDAPSRRHDALFYLYFFSPLENEQTIEYLLQQYPEFRICEMEGYEGFAQGIPEASESGDEALRRTVRIFPHRMKGEGHFLALLRKGEAGSQPCSPALKAKGIKLPAELEEFLRDVDRDMEPSRIDLRGGRVYYMPEDLPSLKGIRFLRTGLLLGELKKNRFEPSQAFAMNLKKEEYRRTLDLPAEDPRVVRYLKGETLDVEDLVSNREKRMVSGLCGRLSSWVRQAGKPDSEE